MLAAGLALGAPSTAQAHLRSGVIAVGYRASITSAPRTITATIYESDRSVALTVAPGRVVVVRGYQGEPFARIDQSGTAVNAVSLTAAGLGLLPKAPKRVGWLPRSSARTFVWHDGRLRALPADVGRARWTIPLVVDGKAGALSGILERVSPPSIWVWSVIAVAVLLLGAILARPPLRVSRTMMAVAFGVTSVAAMLVASVGFAFDRYASTGKWTEVVIELIFVAVAVAFLVAGSPQVRVVAGGALGLLGLAVGLSLFQVLRSGFVLSALPGTVVRLAVVISISAGAVATVYGLLVRS